MQVQTVYMPRGRDGTTFILLTDGNYYKWSPNGRMDQFVKTSQAEFEQYREESFNLVWNKYTESWGTWNDLASSMRDAGIKIKN